MVHKIEKEVREKYEKHGFKVIHKGAPDFLCYQLDEDRIMQNIIFVEVKQNNSDLTVEQKLWREALKICFRYRVETPDGVRKDDLAFVSSIRCSCVASTPKGVSYHPSLKAVYERSGAKGILKKVGLRCPKCGKYYDLEGKTL